ncbi:MAG: DUF1232 domain-containing protein [bacterium]|nr:DUF1232 domain-containing protein [bacterium]
MQVLQGLIDQLRLTWRLIRDPRVPFYLKAVPFLGLVYIVSPLDFIPDIIPFFGQLDDLGILLAGMKTFETLAPAYVVQEHRDAMAFGTGTQEKQKDVIDGSRLKIDREKPKRG